MISQAGEPFLKSPSPAGYRPSRPRWSASALAWCYVALRAQHARREKTRVIHHERRTFQMTLFSALRQTQEDVSQVCPIMDGQGPQCDQALLMIHGIKKTRLELWDVSHGK
jgi:hypothetical protein